jgi:hypothetical protein
LAGKGASEGSQPLTRRQLTRATWRVDRKKEVAALTVEPFASFSARTRKEVIAEGESLLRFTEPDARSFEVRVAT